MIRSTCGLLLAACVLLLWEIRCLCLSDVLQKALILYASCITVLIRLEEPMHSETKYCSMKGSVCCSQGGSNYGQHGHVQLEEVNG